jgi:hypothetical protein
LGVTGADKAGLLFAGLRLAGLCATGLKLFVGLTTARAVGTL